MKTIALIFLSASVGFGIAWFTVQPSMSSTTNDEAQPLYWVAPMDPNYRRDKPGQSPMGMDLVPVYEDNKNDDNAVTINPSMQHNLGLQLSPVVFGILPQYINTTGYIQFDEEKLGHVHSRVEGWVEKLYPSAVGDFIQQGDPLYSIYSPALVNAQDEYVSALNSGNARLIKVSAKRLTLLGLSQQQLAQLKKTRKVEQTTTLYSHHSGYINKLNIRDGMYIRPDTETLSIADLSSVWLIAEVFERQSMLLKKGQKVLITIDSLPGQQWQAELDYIYPILNPRSRTVQVRIVLDNTNNLLKPNMFASVSIEASAEKKTLSVPRSAVIRGGHGDRVVKQINETQFQSTAVITGVENGQFIEITKGLTEGEKVVTSGQFLIDSESNIDSELAKMTPPETSEQNRGHQHHD